MANGLYTKFKQQLLNKQQDLDTDDCRAILSDSADYTVNLSTHDFLDDVAAGARVATSASGLTGATVTDGVWDVADFSWSAVTGDVSEQVIFYNHGMGGSDAARGLICFFDTGVSGLPITPNGGNINVTVNASGVFTL